MLPKKHRLKKKREFNFIYKKGKAYFSKYLAMYVASTKFEKSKIGFSVNNKVGNSVVRHKVKRRLSEAVKKILNDLPKNNYVFVAKIGSEKLGLLEFEENIKYLIKKAL